MVRLDLSTRQLRIVRTLIISEMTECRKHLARLELLYENDLRSETPIIYQKYAKELEDLDDMVVPVLREANLRGQEEK